MLPHQSGKAWSFKMELSTIWESIVRWAGTIEFADFLDVAIVSYLIYKIIKLVRDTRAEQLVKGFVLLAVGYLLVDIFKLTTMSFLLQNVLTLGVTALVVVFQPELRRALEQVGRVKIGLTMFSQGDIDEDEQERRWHSAVSALCESAVSLSRQKIGALIVIERETKLGEIIKTGTVIDADVSAELVGNVFFPNSPLHDGAMMIRNGKLYAAGCFLPISDNQSISKTLGTRHRAALGMSENSDAVIIVVSEETGVISVAENGKLIRNYDAATLQERLEKTLFTNKLSEFAEKRPSFWKGKSK